MPMPKTQKEIDKITREEVMVFLEDKIKSRAAYLAGKQTPYDMDREYILLCATKREADEPK